MQRRMTLLRNASAFALHVPPGPDVVGFAAKPFELAFTTTGDRRQQYTPDHFLCVADGGAVVVDVSPMS